MKLTTTIFAAVAGLAIGCGAGVKDDATTPKADTHEAKAADGHEVKADGHEAKGADAHKGHMAHKGHEGHEGHKGHEAGKKHEHHFTAEMKTFHDTMKPLWHAKHGDKRTADTCAAAATLATQGQAVAAATKPGHAVQATWDGATKTLVERANKLVASCAGDKKDFEATFKTLHEGFHGVMAAMKKDMKKDVKKDVEKK